MWKNQALCPFKQHECTIWCVEINLQLEKSGFGGANGSGWMVMRGNLHSNLFCQGKNGPEDEKSSFQAKDSVGRGICDCNIRVAASDENSLGALQHCVKCERALSHSAYLYNNVMYIALRSLCAPAAAVGLFLLHSRPHYYARVIRDHSTRELCASAKTPFLYAKRISCDAWTRAACQKGFRPRRGVRNTTADTPN